MFSLLFCANERCRHSTSLFLTSPSFHFFLYFNFSVLANPFKCPDKWVFQLSSCNFRHLPTFFSFQLEVNGKSTFCAHTHAHTHIHISYVIILHYIKCRHKLLAMRKRKICQKGTVLSLLMKRVGAFLITITSDSLNQQPLRGTMLLCFHRIMFKAGKQCSHSILREKKRKRLV